MQATTAAATRRRLTVTAARAFHTSGNLTNLSVTAFGASTDVGKTIICAGLCRAALARRQRVAYIKPVQSGNELDEYFVRVYTNPEGNRDITCETLYRWNSHPFPAISADGQQEIPDNKLRKYLSSSLSQFHAASEGEHSFTIIETAAGVLSPGPSSALQADLYRPFRHPVVLVGDSRLGGITSTLTALEALILRGYTVYAVCLILQHGATSIVNTETIRRHSHPAIPIYHFSPLPTDRLLHAWFKDNQHQFADMFSMLWSRAQNETTELRRLRSKATKVLWWDDGKRGFDDTATFVESGHGDSYRTVEFDDDGGVIYRNQLDASSLAQGVGAGNRGMSLTLAHAAGRYGQMISGGVYPPSVLLSEQLLESKWGPGYPWAKRAMFAENSSIAMDFATKIAQKVYRARKLSRGSIGGDAGFAADRVKNEKLGLVLSLSEQCLFRKPKIAVPKVAWKNGHLHIDVSTLPGVAQPEYYPDAMAGLFDLTRRTQEPLAEAYRQYIQTKLDESEPLTALVLQPIANIRDDVWFVDPLFQKIVIQECKARNMTIVFDEITTGLWRLGRVSASEHLGESPDIAVHGRLVTGGYIDLGIVLATEEVYDASRYAFQRQHHALNPISAMAGLEVLDQYRSCAQYDAESNSMPSPWPEQDVKQLSLCPGVSSAMAMGHVLLVELKQASLKEEVVRHLHQHNVHVHTRGHTVTVLVTPMTSSRACVALLLMLRHVLEDLKL